MCKKGWRDGQREVVEKQVQTGSSPDKQGQISKYMDVSHKMQPANNEKELDSETTLGLCAHVQWTMAHGSWSYSLQKILIYLAPECSISVHLVSNPQAEILKWKSG